MKKERCALCKRRRGFWSLWNFTDKENGSHRICKPCLELVCEIITTVLRFKKSIRESKARLV